MQPVTRTQGNIILCAHRRTKGGECITDIKIVDSLMGSGKTSWAIRYMNEHPDQPFIFITPYLSEGERIQSACPDLDFAAPTEGPTKQADFHKLLREGRNMAISHELFKVSKLSKPELELVQEYGYILILDEMLDVLDLVKISNDDRNDLIAQKRIIVSESGEVSWAGGYSGVFNPLMREIKRKAVQQCESGELLWMFPIELLAAFKEVYILTFMFEGSIMEQYLKIHELSGEYHYIKDNQLVTGRQDLTEERRRLKGLIKIYEGPLNEIGADPHKLKTVKRRDVPRKMPFSKGWMEEGSKNDNVKQSMKNAYNFLANHMRADKDTAMWSMLKDNRQGKNPHLCGHYVKSFCPCNCRASNDYRHKYHLAYLVDVYCNPVIITWLEKYGGSIDPEAYALSQLLQWMWRSRLRDGEDIHIYLPSQRMRELLQAWLEV